jgi:hypothetical protein
MERHKVYYRERSGASSQRLSHKACSIQLARWKLEMVRLLSKVCAFYEEGHAIMDCPFMPFHIKASIIKHVEL